MNKEYTPKRLISGAVSLFRLMQLTHSKKARHSQSHAYLQQFSLTNAEFLITPQIHAEILVIQGGGGTQNMNSSCNQQKRATFPQR